MSKRCSAKNRNGEQCGAWAVTHGEKCALHSDRGRASRLGSNHGRKAGFASPADATPMQPPKTAGDVRDALANAMSEVYARQMDAKTANALAYLGTSLLRGIEVSDLESRLAALEAIHQARERAFLPTTRPKEELKGDF